VLGLGLVVRFGVDWEVVFGSWCGRFLNRLVGEVLEGVGVRIPHGAVKPFSVSREIARGFTNRRHEG
jgi:hypothetical protein